MDQGMSLPLKFLTLETAWHELGPHLRPGLGGFGLELRLGLRFELGLA